MGIENRKEEKKTRATAEIPHHFSRGKGKSTSARQARPSPEPTRSRACQTIRKLFRHETVLIPWHTKTLFRVFLTLTTSTIFPPVSSFLFLYFHENKKSKAVVIRDGPGRPWWVFNRVFIREVWGKKRERNESCNGHRPSCKVRWGDPPHLHSPSPFPKPALLSPRKWGKRPRLRFAWRIRIRKKRLPGGGRAHAQFLSPRFQNWICIPKKLFQLDFHRTCAWWIIDELSFPVSN